MNENSNPLHRPLAVGDWVIVGKGEEYAGLSGVIKEVIPRGSPEHDTGNSTDDIVVDLTVLGYSDRMKAEITARMNELGYVATFYDDVPIDSVILAPEELIQITDDELVQYSAELAASMECADIVGETLSSRHFDEIYKAFTARVEQNYEDYERETLKFGALEIFEMAARVHAVSDAYSYLTVYHNYSEEEMRFYLQFQNPLDIVAQQWHERNMDISDMSFTMEYLMERRSVLEETNALVHEKSQTVNEPLSAQRFEKIYHDFLDNAIQSNAEPAHTSQQPNNPKKQPSAFKQPPSLLGEVREAALEVEARKMAQATPANQKSIKKENELT